MLTCENAGETRTALTSADSRFIRFCPVLLVTMAGGRRAIAMQGKCHDRQGGAETCDGHRPGKGRWLSPRC